MTAVAYEWHNYGKSTIGNRSDIERVPVDNLRDFYKRFYQPDNAVLVVAGKFDETKALEYITKYFGAIPEARPQAARRPTPKSRRRTASEWSRCAGWATSAWSGLLFHVPAASHAEFPAVEILGEILSSEPSGRLYKALVETKKATSVSVDESACHDPGSIQMMAEVNTKDLSVLEKVRDDMLTVVEEVAQKGVTQEEVDRARQRILKNRELAAADPNRIAIELSEWSAQGDWRLYFLNRDRIEQVTPEQVKAGRSQLFHHQQSNRRLLHPDHEGRANAGSRGSRHRQARRRLRRPPDQSHRQAKPPTSRLWPSKPA